MPNQVGQFEHRGKRKILNVRRGFLARAESESSNTIAASNASKAMWLSLASLPAGWDETHTPAARHWRA